MGITRHCATCDVSLSGRVDNEINCSFQLKRQEWPNKKKEGKKEKKNYKKWVLPDQFCLRTVQEVSAIFINAVKLDLN